MVHLVGYVWYGKFNLVGLVWLGLVGNVKLAISSYFYNLLLGGQLHTFLVSWSVQVGRTTGKVIIELPGPAWRWQDKACVPKRE